MRITTKPIEKEFPLKFGLSEDTQERAIISVRQARTGDRVRETELFAEQTQIWEDADLGKVQLKRRYNRPMLERYRAYLTLTACNLVDEEDQPIFKFNSNRRVINEDAFNRAWDSLPVELTDEIYEKILEVNPQWSLVQLEGEE